MREELRRADVFVSSFDYLQIAVEYSPPQPEDPSVLVHRREYLDFSVSLPQGTLAGAELPA